MANPVEIRHHISQHRKELLPIRIILEDRLTTITARRHVIQRTSKFKSERFTEGEATLLDPAPSLLINDSDPIDLANNNFWLTGSPIAESKSGTAHTARDT